MYKFAASVAMLSVPLVSSPSTTATVSNSKSTFLTANYNTKNVLDANQSPTKQKAAITLDVPVAMNFVMCVDHNGVKNMKATIMNMPSSNLRR